MIELWIGLGAYALIGVSMFVTLMTKRLEVLEQGQRSPGVDPVDVKWSDIAAAITGGIFWPVILVAKLLCKLL